MAAIAELLVACALLPLAYTDLRAQVSGTVTVSDASESGGGCCASVGVTYAGASLEQARDKHFMPLGAMAAPPVKMPPGTTYIRVFVLALFDGAGGLMVSLSKLPVKILGYASSETDKVARKLVRMRWPGVIELGDVRSISGAIVHKLWDAMCEQIDMIFGAGGSPCQDLSRLLANRRGLEGDRSMLFFELVRVFDLVRDIWKCAFHWFVENVFSMRKVDLRRFNTTLGVTPYLIDAAMFTQCARPRLFRCSWALAVRPGVRNWVL